MNLLKTAFSTLTFIIAIFVFQNCSKPNESIPLPAASFSWESTENGILFTNTSKDAESYEWDFGDGSAKIVDKNPLHNYAQNGKYTVLLKAKNTAGISESKQEITVTNNPTADFSFVDGNFIAPVEIIFTNKSSNAINYQWDFGDGSSLSNEVSPKHIFQKGGIFLVTLIAKKASSENKFQKTITIKDPIFIEGKIICTQTNIPVANATITDVNDNVLAKADQNGAFKIKSLGTNKPIKVKISADGFITRTTNILDNAHTVAIDIIENKPPFSADYYGQLVFWTNSNFSLTERTAPQANKAWNINPKIYIKTTLNIYNNGTFEKSSSEKVSQVALDKVTESLPIIFKEVTQDKIKIEKIEYGTERIHLNEAGWITIEFFDRTNNPQPFSGTGGNSSIGNSMYGTVRVGTTDISDTKFPCKIFGAGLIFHEMGHCLGLGHTTNLDPPNMMAGGIACFVNEAHYSSLEKYHTQIMYARPRGNQYPDNDPDGFAF